jgi:Ca2+-binding EF-hand superfamily protein
MVEELRNTRDNVILSHLKIWNHIFGLGTNLSSLSVAMLTQEEIDKCREAFERFDKDGSGTIDAWELKETLKAMGQNPSDEDIFQMLSQVDDDGSGAIDFPEFLKVIEAQKEKMEAENDETDVLAAWVAMGGNPDKSGQIDTEKLRRTIKAFELTIDIDRLIEETDTDGSGFIDYEEFKAMFG